MINFVLLLCVLWVVLFVVVCIWYSDVKTEFNYFMMLWAIIFLKTCHSSLFKEFALTLEE